MKNGFYSFARSFVQVLLKLPYKLRFSDNSSIPEEGGLIVCANHYGVLDPVFIAASIKRDFTFMAKKELFSFRPFGWLIKKLGAFPVDRANSDITALKTSIRLLKGGHAMLLFPQGTRCKCEDNISAKHGAVRLAIMTGAPILPVYISENHKPFVKKSYVNVGNAIDYSEYKGTHLTEDDYERLSVELMETIYGLSSEAKEAK